MNSGNAGQAENRTVRDGFPPAPRFLNSWLHIGCAKNKKDFGKGCKKDKRSFG
ncbi:MAG: hypothetical protein KH366_25315 [Clostridiaceae bacterium]|nr:hypothetical protein [Clostridiaceae bacterium]